MLVIVVHIIALAVNSTGIGDTYRTLGGAFFNAVAELTAILTLTVIILVAVETVATITD